MRPLRKRSHGELARLGQPRAGRDRHLNHVAQHHGRAMARNLDHIVSRVGVWLGEEGDDNLVDAFAAGRLDQLTEMSVAGFEVMLVRQPQHGTGNSAGISPRYSHHANPAASRRRGDGDDGVVKMHELNY
jgi:hypothetical protein